MTDREKKELIEAEETILQLLFDAYERAMKYTKGNINLSLRMAAMLVSAMVHDQTERRKASPFNFCGKWGGITNDAGNNNGVFVLRERWL